MREIGAARGPVTAVLGPTNTGKTSYAIERMLGHKTGVMGFPLRLLAREVYDRIVALRGPSVVALITGEEKIVPPRAQYFICTVESMPVGHGHDFLAVDEIQLCADPERGHVFTDRLLNARGQHETLMLGAATMKHRIAQLVPGSVFIMRERFSELSYAGGKKISRLPPRSAVVAFSADQVYAIAELIRRQKGGAAVVMGALSPRTRNAQVDMFQHGEVDYLVATDAIGMGLNLDLKTVWFAGTSKFDGRRSRMLEPQELAQIAGRAGRYTTHGSFGVTADCGPLDPETVEAIEEHRFPGVGALQFRNSDLDFRSPTALLLSLERSPETRGLQRAREGSDMAALRALAADYEIADIVEAGAQSVKLLWEVCQVPDFRKTMQSEHNALLARLYQFLTGRARTVPDDWLAGQIERIDRTDGDIDALSKRLAYIRTWTYVANRAAWVQNAAEWREKTRAVEDRLSDALHACLTQRFVDRRTSALMKRLKQKEDLVATVEQDGAVTVEGEYVGRIEGLRFLPDPSAEGVHGKTLRAASAAPLAAALRERVETFYNCDDKAIDYTEQGGLVWDNTVVGRIEPGPDALSPEVKAFADDLLEADVQERVRHRLKVWIDKKIATLFEPLVKMQADESLQGLARGVAFQLIEGLGILPRGPIARDVKALEQDARAALRKHGLRFGQYTLFVPTLLKPAPTRLRVVLWSVFNKLDEAPSPPPPGVVTITAIKDAPEAFYSMAGYRLAGERALRLDMLERLADMLRPLDQRGGFEATPEMLSITGLSLEQFAGLMDGLGFRGERGERVKATAKPKQPDTPKAPETPLEAAILSEPVISAPAIGLAPDVAPPAEAEVAPAEGEPDKIESVTLAEGSSETISPEVAAPAEEAGAPEAQAETDSPKEAPEQDAPAADAPKEVFYTFRILPNGRRQRGEGGDRQDRKPRRDGNRSAKQGEGGQADGEKRDRPPRKRGKSKPQGGGEGKPQGERKPREDRGGGKRDSRPVDPDSPFAVLQQLKNRS